MMGASDGFTLVKGISSYGLTKARKRANIDNRFSEMTKTYDSQFDGMKETKRTKKLGGTERRQKHHKTIDVREVTYSDDY